MGLLGNLFGSKSVDFNEEIRSAYQIKGFVKTDIDWEKAFSFAKERSSLIYDGDEDVNFYMYLDAEDVYVRFLRNPRTGKTIIIVSNADLHRQMIKEMESGEFDSDKYPSYKLEF